MMIRTFISAAFILILGGCASTPEAPVAPSLQAPWAEYGRPEFRDLLVSYGTTNLHLRRDDALDLYLRSQTKTFDRYVAAKEVGVGIEALQEEAIAEIQCNRLPTSP